MFPVSDVIPSRTTPVVTLGLIAVTAIVFLCELQLDLLNRQALVSTLGVVPAAVSWPAAFTSPFLHAGWIHLATSLVYAWIFGGNVEDAFGRVRFFLFYVACGSVAAVVHVAAHPGSVVPMVGAGGAVAGVMGAYLVLYPRSRVLTVVLVPFFLELVEIPALFFLGVWFLLQLFTGVGSIGVEAADGPSAFWSQIAGFTAGAIVGAYSRFSAAVLRRYWR